MGQTNRQTGSELRQSSGLWVIGGTHYSLLTEESGLNNVDGGQIMEPPRVLDTSESEASARSPYS